MALWLVGAVPVYLLVVLAEIWLRRNRPEVYYGTGIPVMNWAGPAGALRAPERLAALADEVVGLVWVGLPAGGFGLNPARQRLDPWFVSARKNNALTRGWLRIDPERQTIRLTVYLNWHNLIFLVAWFSFAFAIPITFVSIIFLTLGSLIIYLMLRGEREIYLDLWGAVTAS